MASHNFKKDFLSHLCPNVSYLMSVVVHELAPNSNVWLSQYTNFPRLHDRQIDTMQIRFVQNRIRPVLKQKHEKLESFTDEDIADFMRVCVTMNRILQGRYQLKELVKIDMDTYEFCIKKINQAEWLSNENRIMAVNIVEILSDYIETVSIIADSRKTILEDVIKKADPDELADLYKSLYGSLFAFICMMSGILAEFAHHTNTNTLTRIINQGYELSQNLDSFTDTLDILTNPAELELLKKSESENL